MRMISEMAEGAVRGMVLGIVPGVLVMLACRHCPEVVASVIMVGVPCLGLGAVLGYHMGYADGRTVKR
jgi:uncharacterized membrane protein (Fun14 family)